MNFHWLIIVTAYLLGSIPFGLLIVKAGGGDDIRQRGSGNIGAANVARNAGLWAGSLTLLLDAAKGYSAVWIAGRWADGSDSTRWMMAAAVAAVLASDEFKAGANETLLLHAPAGLAAKRLLLVGVGKSAKATAHSVRSAVGTAVRFAKPRGIRAITFALPEAAELPPGPCSRAAVEGALLADYDPDTYRSDRKDQSVYDFTLVGTAGDSAAAVELGYAEGIIVAESQNFARELVNEPGNKLTPTILGQRAAVMAAANGLKSEVYSTEKLHELKMGAFWSVSQGSEEPPALIVLTYEPEGYDAATYTGLFDHVRKLFRRLAIQARTGREPGVHAEENRALVDPVGAKRGSGLESTAFDRGLL